MKKTFLLIGLFVLAFTLTFVGCATAPELPQSAPKSDAALEIEAPVELGWDAKPERALWTAALMKAIDDNWTKLLGAQDVHVLCPNYPVLLTPQKKEVWAEIFVAISYYESAWKPDTRYFEKTMGYYSEGLFQLSVVDEKWAQCGLTKANILQPEPNIKCAVDIMARQVLRHTEILLHKNVYWAVIKEGGKFQKINEIKKMVAKNATMCNGLTVL